MNLNFNNFSKYSLQNNIIGKVDKAKKGEEVKSVQAEAKAEVKFEKSTDNSAQLWNQLDLLANRGINIVKRNNETSSDTDTSRATNFFEDEEDITDTQNITRAGSNVTADSTNSAVGADSTTSAQGTVQSNSVVQTDSTTSAVGADSTSSAQGTVQSNSVVQTDSTTSAVGADSTSSAQGSSSTQQTSSVFSNEEIDAIVTMLADSDMNVSSADVKQMITDLTAMANSKGVDATEYISIRLVEFLAMRQENPNMTLEEMNTELAINNISDLMLSNINSIYGEIFGEEVQSFNDLLELQLFATMGADYEPDLRSAYMNTRDIIYMQLAQSGEFTNQTYYDYIVGDFSNLFPQSADMSDEEINELTANIKKLSPEQILDLTNKTIDLPSIDDENYQTAYDNFIAEFNNSVSGSNYTVTNPNGIVDINSISQSRIGCEFNADELISAIDNYHEAEDAMGEAIIAKTVEYFDEQVQNGEMSPEDALWQVGFILSGSTESEDILNCLKNITGMDNIRVEGGRVIIETVAGARGTRAAQSDNSEDNSEQGWWNSVVGFCSDVFHSFIEPMAEDIMPPDDPYDVTGQLNWLADTFRFTQVDQMVSPMAMQAELLQKTAQWLEDNKEGIQNGSITMENAMNYGLSEILSIQGRETFEDALEGATAALGTVFGKVAGKVFSPIVKNIVKPVLKSADGFVNKVIQKTFNNKILIEDCIGSGTKSEGLFSTLKNLFSGNSKNTQGLFPEYEVNKILRERVKNGYKLLKTASGNAELIVSANDNKLISLKMKIKYYSKGKSPKEIADMAYDTIVDIGGYAPNQRIAAQNSLNFPKNTLLGDLLTNVDIATKSVCRHRATAFDALTSGINSYRVLGRNCGCPHMWNIVEDSGHYYMYDAFLGVKGVPCDDFIKPFLTAEANNKRTISLAPAITALFVAFTTAAANAQNTTQQTGQSQGQPTTPSQGGQPKDPEQPIPEQPKDPEQPKSEEIKDLEQTKDPEPQKDSEKPQGNGNGNGSGNGSSSGSGNGNGNGNGSGNGNGNGSGNGSGNGNGNGQSSYGQGGQSAGQSQGGQSAGQSQGQPTTPSQGQQADPSQGQQTDPSQGQQTDPSQGQQTDQSQGQQTDSSQQPSGNDQGSNWGPGNPDYDFLYADVDMSGINIEPTTETSTSQNNTEETSQTISGISAQQLALMSGQDPDNLSTSQGESSDIGLGNFNPDPQAAENYFNNLGDGYHYTVTQNSDGSFDITRTSIPQTGGNSTSMGTGSEISDNSASTIINLFNDWGEILSYDNSSDIAAVNGAGTSNVSMDSNNFCGYNANGDSLSLYKEAVQLMKDGKITWFNDACEAVAREHGLSLLGPNGKEISNKLRNGDYINKETNEFDYEQYAADCKNANVDPKSIEIQFWSTKYPDGTMKYELFISRNDLSDVNYSFESDKTGKVVLVNTEVWAAPTFDELKAEFLQGVHVLDAGWSPEKTAFEAMNQRMQMVATKIMQINICNYLADTIQTEYNAAKRLLQFFSDHGYAGTSSIEYNDGQIQTDINISTNAISNYITDMCERDEENGYNSYQQMLRMSDRLMQIQKINEHAQEWGADRLETEIDNLISGACTREYSWANFDTSQYHINLNDLSTQQSSSQSGVQNQPPHVVWNISHKDLLDTVQDELLDKLQQQLKGTGYKIGHPMVLTDNYTSRPFILVQDQRGNNIKVSLDGSVNSPEEVEFLTAIGAMRNGYMSIERGDMQNPADIFLSMMEVTRDKSQIQKKINQAEIKYYEALATYSMSDQRFIDAQTEYFKLLNSYQSSVEPYGYNLYSDLSIQIPSMTDSSRETWANYDYWLRVHNNLRV